MDSQNGSVVEAVQEALVMGYIEYESPLTKLALEGDVVELLAKFRQFVFPSTRADSRLHLAGRAEAWDEYDYKQLIMLFQTALADQKGQDTNPPAPPRAESRKGAKIYYRPPPSCLSRVCGCVTWTINLCVIAGILGLLGFIAMDERRTTVQFWVELVRPPVPVEERLNEFTKAVVREHLNNVHAKLTKANNKDVMEMRKEVQEYIQTVEPAVQKLKDEVKAAKNQTRQLLEKIDNATKQQATLGTNLVVLREEVQVLKNETYLQAKEINHRRAAMDDLMSSFDVTKEKFVSFIAQSEYLQINVSRRMDQLDALVENRTNCTLEKVSRRLDDFEKEANESFAEVRKRVDGLKKVVNESFANVSHSLDGLKQEVAQVKANTTQEIKTIMDQLAGVSRMASQILASTNNALFLADGGWLLNGYISLTFKGVGLTVFLHFIQWPLVFLKARVNKKAKIHQKLTLWLRLTIWFGDLLLCNVLMCVCVVAAYITYSMCAAVKNDFTVRCVAYVCGCIMSGLNAVFGN